MSSSYYALCTSHTPAITISADLGHAEADHLTSRHRFTGHDQCDILIERVSGGPVEIACPGTQLPGPTGCKSGHREVEWIDVAWLRLLSTAMNAPAPVDPELLRHISTYGCWTRERMASLRAELGLPESTPEAAETAAARAVVATVTPTELHDAIRKLAQRDPAWWRTELARMARFEGRADIFGGHK